MGSLIEKTAIPIVKGDTKEQAHIEDVESSNSQEAVDLVAAKKLLWKVNLHVVPPLAILFLLVFFDRVNIGNAKIQGMTKELHMEGQDYSIAFFIFFIPYFPLVARKENRADGKQIYSP
jgi:hypothetical protein